MRELKLKLEVSVRIILHAVDLRVCTFGSVCRLGKYELKLIRLKCCLAYKGLLTFDLQGTLCLIAVCEYERIVLAIGCCATLFICVINNSFNLKVLGNAIT